jgi:homogentisate 1,2-dioxygenase
MTERAQNFMDQIWSIRNTNPDMTEEQLLSAVLKLAAEQVTSYNAQNDMIVLDKNDLLQLAEELGKLV